MTWAFSEPVAANEIKITPDGHVILQHNGVPLIPESAKAETAYEREKGPKILTRVPLNPHSLQINPSIALTKHSFVFAIDTNTVRLGSGTVSTTVTARCDFSDQGRLVMAKYRVLQGIEFRNMQGKPENAAWWVILNELTRTNEYRNASSIGVVVDSDLDNLVAYNSRARPFFRDAVLPEKVELVYASAETGPESIGNVLIAECDKAASKLAAQILRYPDNRNGLLAADNVMPFTHFRTWKPNE